MTGRYKLSHMRLLEIARGATYIDSEARSYCVLHEPELDREGVVSVIAPDGAPIEMPARDFATKMVKRVS